MQTATNPETGEKVYWDDGAGEWLPMPQEQAPLTVAPTVRMPEAGLEDLRAGREPYVPIPQPQAFPMRQTPVSRTPLEAARQATGGEMLSLLTGARSLANLAQMDQPERQEMQSRLEQIRTEQAERGEQFPVPTFLGQAAPYGILPQAMVSTLPRAALTGAAIGGLTSGGEPISTGAGAAGGLGGAWLGRRLAQPFVPSPQAQELMAMGVQPSVGQAVRQRGPLGRMISAAEEKAADVPVMGDAILRARARPQEEVIEEAFRRATPRGYTPPATDDARVAMRQLRSTLNDAYDAVYEGTEFVQRDADRLALNRAVADRDIRVTDEARAQAVARANDLIDLRADEAGTIAGRELKEVESILKSDASDLLKSQSAEDRQTGLLYENLVREVQRWRDSQLPAEMRQQAREADRAYANYLRLQRATSAIGAEEGEFTPAQLYNAVRAMDQSLRKGAVSEGRALMQDLAEPAKSVLRTVTPQSGTIPRGLQNVLMLGGTAGLANVSPLAALPFGAGMLGAWATQPRWVQRYLTGNYPWMQQAQQAAQRAGVALGTQGESLLPR